ncbi:MAG TPA: PAS domain S-box protein [Ignavibacteria bacterium]|jgi:PAS domain S-box-containing protein
MGNLSIGKGGVTAFFIMGIMVLISSSVVAYLNYRDQANSHEYINEALNRIDIAGKIHSAVSDAEASRRGYQITNDRQYITSINNAKIIVDSLLKTMRVGLNGNAKQQQKTDTLFLLCEERFELFKRAIELQQKNGANDKLLRPIMDRGKIVSSDMHSIISRVTSEEESAITNKQAIEHESYRFTFYTVAGGAFVSCIIFIIVFILLKKIGKGGSAEDEEITREELETIVRDRTAEVSQINNKLNFKITELEKKDKELQHSEEYYRMLFNQAHDAILIIDPHDERVLDANNRTCEIYGFKREDLIGLSLKAISKNVAQGEEHLKKILEKGNHNFQTVHYNKKLNEILMEINASVIDYNGRKAILSIHRDITERVLVIH